MLSARSIEDIQSTYFAALATSGSNLVVDTKEGSLAYTLARGSAAVSAAIDNRLIDLQNNALITNASGSRLDELLSFISPRQQPARATGSVLAISKTDSFTIPAGTQLINVSTGLSFRTTSASVTAVNLFESLINIQAVEFGTSSNLVAGTQLYSADYPDVCFRVGATHTEVYEGDLLGGQDIETDNAYRSRVLSLISNPSSSSSSSLVRLLRDYPLVDRAYVKTTVPGIVEIWVDASTIYTEAQRQELLDYISTYLPVGVIPFISQARRKPVNITLDIQPFSNNNNDLSALSNRVTSNLTNLILNLDVGESLSVGDIRRSVSSLARQVTVVYPTADIVCRIDEILSPGEFKFVFSANLFK